MSQKCSQKLGVIFSGDVSLSNGWRVVDVELSNCFDSSSSVAKQSSLMYGILFVVDIVLAQAPNNVYTSDLSSFLLQS